MHHLCMPLMVGLEGFNGFLPILRTISHLNRAALQFICFSGKGMRLEIAVAFRAAFTLTQRLVQRALHMWKSSGAFVIMAIGGFLEISTDGWSPHISTGH
jgi:hypothetical protein